MYRERLITTAAETPASKQLKSVMLSYHDYRHTNALTINPEHLQHLTDWQSQRLKTTHHDLYASDDYRAGLSFLLSQLYSTDDFSARDTDLERVFPKLVKWLPDSVIETVAILVELNLLTQQLDDKLCQILFTDMAVSILDAESYSDAYRACNNYNERLRQIQLVALAGQKLDRYSRSAIIHFALKMSRASARKAGLQALHGFIKTGFDTFHTMKDIDFLMSTLVYREQTILNNLYQGLENPFQL